MIVRHTDVRFAGNMKIMINMVKTRTLKCKVTVTKKGKTRETVTSKPSQKPVVSPGTAPTARPNETPTGGSASSSPAPDG